MKYLGAILITLNLGTVSLFGTDGKALANKYKISASVKAGIQWTRIFENDGKMAKLGVSSLSVGDKKALLDYLVKHAADSDAPTAAGM
jgi:hypothetical protein